MSSIDTHHTSCLAACQAKKQPFHVYRADEQPLVMAGLWESRNDPERGNPIETYAILTTDANEQLRDLHDRLPMILGPEQFDAWLDPVQDDKAPLQSLLKPAADGVLAMHPVSTRVNSPKHEDASLIEPNQSDRAVRPDRGEQSVFE